MRAAPPAASTARADRLILNALIAVSIVYTLAFNLMPDGPRTQIAGLIGLGFILRCILSWPDPAAQLASFLFLGLCYIPLFTFIFVLEPGHTSPAVFFGNTVRMLTCTAVFVCFSLAPRVVLPGLLKLLCLSILLAAGAVALTGQPVDLGGIARPATFTGGEEGVHSTGYAVTAAFLGAVTLWRSGWLGSRQALLLALPLLVLVLAFQVRTTWTIVLLYAAATAVIEARMRAGPAAAALLVVFFLAGAIVAAPLLSEVDLSEVSSGRTAVYVERLEMIAGWPAVNILFGTGPGSQLLPSIIWWWAPKNSHNDYLDVTIQVGIAGLLLTLALLVIALRRLDRVQLPLFIGAVGSSAVSNSLMERPFIAALFLAFLAVRRPSEAALPVGAAERGALPWPGPAGAALR